MFTSYFPTYYMGYGSCCVGHYGGVRDMSKISQRIETIEDVRKAVPDVLGNNYLCSLVERAYVCGKRDGAGDTRFHVFDKKTGNIADIDNIALNLGHDPDNDFAGSLCYCDMEGFAIGECGDLYLLDECGAWVYPPDGRFTVVFNGAEAGDAQ